jgi:hypothetical protein
MALGLPPDVRHTADNAGEKKPAHPPYVLNTRIETQARLKPACQYE